LPGVEVGAVDAHGRLLVLFRHATVASSTVHTSLGLVRLDASGRLDSSFGDGGRVRDLDAADETSKWGAAIATQGDTAFVFESIERSASLLGDPDKVLRGLSITSTGTIDSTYGFEGNAGTAEKAGAIGFGGGMYVSNGDRLWKLTPAGKIDSTYGTAGYVDGAEAPSAVAADGTTFFAPLAAAAIYSLGPSGTGQVTVFADLSAHALAVRCDGSVIVGETVLSGSESVQGTLLSSSGAEDASRGNAGTVTRSVDSSAYLFESGVSPVTVDPISGTVTAFAAKHATVQSLVALRVHP
ncbi:MAG TPA: hypothetical protein VF407_15225, partial [Polyangiaceae bacterium]